MHHNFTYDQIEQAVLEAAKKRGGFSVYQMVDSAPHNVTLGEVGDLRTFLRALPELDTPYPEIALDDVRKGDRVRITTSMGNHYEVTVDRMDSYTWRWNGGSVYIDAIERVYLIERPVKHPDPDNNRVILVREVHGKTYDPPVVAIVRDSSTQNHPVYVYGDNGSAFPDYITDWSPARVVSADE